jgi:hypothetical protein
MQPPDEVEHDEDEVVFLWHEAKLAVVVDCSEAAAEVPLDARVPGGWGQA